MNHSGPLDCFPNGIERAEGADDCVGGLVFGDQEVVELDVGRK